MTIGMRSRDTAMHAVWGILALILGACAASAQNHNLKPGKFLVARKRLPDPNFADTVVLIIEYEKKGAMGLIINWESTVPIARALREFEEAKGRRDRVFVGGPVARSGVQALLRSKTKPADARHVFADVYLISTMDLLRKTLADTEHPNSVRVYIGYSGWAAGQLDNEMTLGTWHVVDGDAATVFDPEPQTVWQRMLERTELRFALDPGFTHSTLRFQ